MKNLNSKNSKINGVFSAFLVIGYIICAYFFSSLANQLTGTKGSLVQIAILFVFGLLLFYATRVGEGKQIRRFSPAVLLLIDLPALYIIIASFFPNFPFSAAINPALAQQAQAAGQVAVQSSGPSIILILACVALGYGLPYTFFSGYEISLEDAVEEEVAQESEMVEGGIAADLAEAEEPAEAAEETAEVAEESAEAVEETAEVAEETAEEAAEEATEAVEETAEEAAEEATEVIEEEKEGE